MVQLKTLNKRIPTKSQGVFYKEIVNEQNRVVDKVYCIRWTDADGISRFKTVGKHSQGIRITTCTTLRNNTLTATTLGHDAPHLTKARALLTLNDIAKKYFKASKAKDADRMASRYKLYFEDSLGRKRIDNITLEDLEVKQKQLLEKLAPATVNLIMGMISTIYNHYIKRGGNIVNPAKGITHCKLDNKRERYLSKNEVIQLEEYLKNDLDCLFL